MQQSQLQQFTSRNVAMEFLSKKVRHEFWFILNSQPKITTTEFQCNVYGNKNSWYTDAVSTTPFREVAIVYSDSIQNSTHKHNETESVCNFITWFFFHFESTLCTHTAQKEFAFHDGKHDKWTVSKAYGFINRRLSEFEHICDIADRLHTISIYDFKWDIILEFK